MGMFTFCKTNYGVYFGLILLFHFSILFYIIVLKPVAYKMLGLSSFRNNIAFLTLSKSHTEREFEKLNKLSRQMKQISNWNVLLYIFFKQLNTSGIWTSLTWLWTYGGLVLGSSQFFATAPAASKNTNQFKSDSK